MVNKRIRKVGDVFYIPLDEQRGALGQVAAIPSSEARHVLPLIAVYEGLHKQSEIVIAQLPEILQSSKVVLLMNTPLHNPTDKRWKFLTRTELPEDMPFQAYSLALGDKGFLTPWDMSERIEVPLAEVSDHPSWGLSSTNNIIDECAKAKHGMKTEWEIGEEYLWRVTPRNDNLASEFFKASYNDEQRPK